MRHDPATAGWGHASQDRRGAALRGAWGSATEMMDVLIALHHPTRRWLAELLWVEGPATVGALAARTGLAVGSVSHDLKPLHRQGFIEPAPDLARDTRGELVADHPAQHQLEPRRLRARQPGSQGRRRGRGGELPLPSALDPGSGSPRWPGRRSKWRRAASSTDSLVKATAAQLSDLHHRQDAVLSEWTQECQEDEREHPDAERRAVRHDLLLSERAGATVTTEPCPAGADRRTATPRTPRPDGDHLAGRRRRVVVRRRGVDRRARLDRRTHAVAGRAGAVLGAGMFPQAALVLLGGVIADRWDPRRVLIAGEVARAVVLVLGALAWQAGFDSAPTLFAIALAFGVVSRADARRPGSRWFASSSDPTTSARCWAGTRSAAG